MEIEPIFAPDLLTVGGVRRTGSVMDKPVRELGRGRRRARIVPTLQPSTPPTFWERRNRSQLTATVFVSCRFRSRRFCGQLRAGLAGDGFVGRVVRDMRYLTRQQTADTKRTHQIRHARRLATHPTLLQRADCRQNRVANDRACTRVTVSNFHGKEGVDGSSPSEGL